MSLYEPIAPFCSIGVDFGKNKINYIYALADTTGVN